MALWPSPRWDHDDFARAVLGATGYEALLEAQAFDIVSVSSTEGAIRWITPGVTRFLEWPPEELIGVNSKDLLHPDDLDLVVADRDDLQRGEQTQRHVRVRSRTGNFRWFATNAVPLRDQDDAVVGIIGGWRCVDDEVAERERAARIAQRLQTFLDSMSDPHASLEAVRNAAGDIVDFRFVDANSAAARFNGVSVEELRGTTLGQSASDQVRQRLVRHFASALDLEGPFALRSRPGEHVELEAGTFWDLVADRVDDNTVVVRWFETTSRDTQARLEAQRAVDESIAVERDRIAADLHDGFIQQVLYTGMMLTTLMPDMPDEMHPAVQRLVSVQDEMIRQLRATILALSRPDIGSALPSVLVERTAREATMHLGMRVYHEVDGALDRIADVGLLQHMLFALREMILNVVRHAEASEMWIRASANDEHVSLLVEDDGRGPGELDQQGHGLANLAARAERLGGSFLLRRREAGGAVADWKVPLLIGL
jgi:PAS domain S-box-containing protein